MVEENTIGRCRMNVSLSAKGLVQFDITAEYPDPMEAAKQLDEAIKQVREVIAQNGLKEVVNA